jgi:NAD(P)-dependent dehydrogenase (short-subunit alcohol dehydrogenase family)
MEVADYGRMVERFSGDPVAQRWEEEVGGVDRVSGCRSRNRVAADARGGLGAVTDSGEGLPGPVVVTGGGSGIGRAAAVACGQRGASVAILDLDRKVAEAAAEEARAAGAPAIIGLECDVRHEASVVAAIGGAANELGEIRGLVCCAGIASEGLVHELPLERWNAVIETNLTGMFLVSKHALAHMLEHGLGGSIVCASSPWGEVSAPGGASAYSASKGGVSALVRSLALDYAARGIRVNAIVPGATETPLMWGDMPEGEIAGARERISEQLAMGRLATPEEIAEGIVWLLSDRAGYATGSHLVIDGGLMARASIES